MLARLIRFILLVIAWFRHRPPASQQSEPVTAPSIDVEPTSPAPEPLPPAPVLPPQPIMEPGNAPIIGTRQAAAGQIRRPQHTSSEMGKAFADAIKESELKRGLCKQHQKTATACRLDHAKRFHRRSGDPAAENTPNL